MLRQFLVGAVASLSNIAIHALVMVAVIKVTRVADSLATSHQTLRLIAVMMATVTVLMTAHLSEVLVWSSTYGLVNAASTGTDLIYFAFVNYTTLGYGDITPVERWHLLGPMTAMNGVLREFERTQHLASRPPRDAGGERRRRNITRETVAA